MKRLLRRLTRFCLVALIVVLCGYGLWHNAARVTHIGIVVASTHESRDEPITAAQPLPLPIPLPAPTPPVVTPPSITPTMDEQDVPIVMYHKTPADFGQQLQFLQSHGYTAVSLEQVLADWRGVTPLPAKPVVLTFDDGYVDQMDAFTLLQKYQDKATFYIINGGAASNWCIGASRRYNDPSQPPEGCGDAYLSWDQIRELDQSGLITIGGHTLDHLALADQTPDIQRAQIADSKAGIEAELGHAIHDFAYPYGSYNSESIHEVQAAGYATAVTTEDGVYHDPGSPDTLSRIRDVYNLP